MVEFTYQMVLSTLQTAALVVGIAYYLFIMRNSQRTQDMTLKNRQAQLLMQMWNRTQSKEFNKDLYTVYQFEWENYDDFIDKYGLKNNPEAWNAFGSILNFCEGLGVMVKNDLIDPSLVDDMESNLIVTNWERFNPILTEFRERNNFPTFCEQFEYLYHQIAPIYYSQNPEHKT